MEYTFLTKDGGECPAELSTAILKDASGNPRGFIAITKEITERKQAEARSLVYRKKLRSLSSQLSLAEERERRRIALQVHDRVSQDLAMCHIRLGALLKTKLSSYCAEQLGEIDGLVRQLIEEVRSLTFEISSPLLYEFGLEAALERFTEQIQAEHGLLCSFEDDGQPKPLDDDIRVLLFQMVRELLVNVIKHAQARKVRVGINKHDNDIRITVEDDGIGFDSRGITSDRKRAKGFGLFSIRERVRYIDGDIQVESERGRGTRVTLVAPLSGSKI